MIAAAVKHATIVRAPPKHGGRNRNGRRRGRHSLLLHRPLIGGGRGKEMIPVIAFHGGVSRGLNLSEFRVPAPPVEPGHTRDRHSDHTDEPHNQ
jgi:hypothetical protein